MPFCWHCGKRTDDKDITCAACGKQQPVVQQTEPAQGQENKPPTAAAQARAGEMPVVIPVGRVVIMGVLGSGIYMIFWMYLTWKHYRDHTGEKAYPVWHALSILVPIYGLFRAHAHIKAYKALMDNNNIPNSLSPMLMVLVLVIINILATVVLPLTFNPETLRPLDELSKDASLTVFILTAIQIAITTAILASVQADINKYWESLKKATVSRARFSTLDIVIAVFGLWDLIWTLGLLAALGE